MASRKGKTAAATDDELSKLFEGIDDAATPPLKSAPEDRTSAGFKAAGKPSDPSEQDLLAEIDKLASERPGSRPHTPRIAATAAGSARSPKRNSTSTPPAGAPTRLSEERAIRKSGELPRSNLASHTAVEPTTQNDVDGQTAAETPLTATASPGGGGWWGGIFATASAAVKTAEAAVKEIQQNEEAKRWAEQVKGNVGALRGIGGELRSRALPTFTNILHTLAPPISSHERLQIHITHDFVGYPSLDPLIYQTFSRVMAQVEGGDLMVIQRGHESSPRRPQDAVAAGGSISGWSDGPWWRQPSERRNLGAVKGLVEGTKLVKVSAESYAHDFYESRGGVEEAAKKAAETLSESNPVRSSDIFLAIQAIGQQPAQADLFGGSSAEAQEQTSVVAPDKGEEEHVQFAIYLHDPVHSITFHTITQSFPQKWSDWLDAHVDSATAKSSSQATSSPEDGKGGAQESGHGLGSNIPDEIAEIIQSGGVDPREWVAEWVEEVITLGVGIVAQRYVARRMGVGEGGIGRGKARQEALESGGGEAARAV
ncbi:MAG: hypothetical protein M1825_003404 [Sarcosagium campestre]|nr:MAG: hypothetical protein M1825_003404 [Sarcosagium campestre]